MEQDNIEKFVQKYYNDKNDTDPINNRNKLIELLSQYRNEISFRENRIYVPKLKTDIVPSYTAALDFFQGKKFQRLMHKKKSRYVYRMHLYK